MIVYNVNKIGIGENDIVVPLIELRGSPFFNYFGRVARSLVFGKALQNNWQRAE